MKIIYLILIFIVLTTISFMTTVNAGEQTFETEIEDISYSMSTYSMWVSCGTIYREIPIFVHSVLSDIWPNDPDFDYDYFKARDLEKSIKELLENALAGRKVEIKIEDYDNKNIFDDAVVSWRILPLDANNLKPLNNKYFMSNSAYNILKNYGDPELFKIVDLYFKEAKIADKNKPEFYDIGYATESSAVKLMFIHELDFPVNFIYKKESLNFDILPTKETGYKWTYDQYRKVKNLITTRNLMDKFSFILDYRSDNMYRFGIRDIQKIVDAPFVNESNIKAKWNDIVGH